MNNKEVGDLGEGIAVEYIKKKGYILIQRNFRCKQGEVDIIAKDKDEYVFIEVKTRNSKRFGQPAEAVNCLKKKHIYNVTRYFLYKYKIENSSIRFDVVEILLNKDGYKLNHIKQIEIE